MLFGDDAKPRQTKTVERGRDRPATGGLRKAVRCLIPPDPEHTTVKNGGKATATLPLPATVTVRVPTTATGGNGHFSCRPAILGGRKAAGNESAAARIPGALFRQLGEWTEPSPATGDVWRKEDVDVYVDTTGADVAAEVGDEDAEVEKERVADISPTRADVIYDARAKVIHDARADVIHDARADVSAYTSDDVTAYTTADVMNPRADIINFMGEKTSNLAKKSAPAPLFIGNIPLHTGSNGIVNDKIADAFNNSTRKTLSFIAPTKQNGEVVVRPSLDTVRDGSKRWKSTAVGYFMGKQPYYHHLKEFAHSVWPALREVIATANGFFFFQFKTKIDMEEVIEGGPWLFHGQPIVLQKWEPGTTMRKLKHTQVPTTEGLSTVASGVGKPLYPDAITRACTRLDFARVCVMIDVTQKIEKHIIIMTPDEDGGETPCNVDIEYEWLPPKCTGCMTLGHSVKECSLINPQKQTKPPVKVYVPKANVPPPPAPEEREKKHKTVVEAEDKVKGEEAWDDNVMDVHILDLGNQFMHCRVTHRADSESLIITIVYGASEMIDRRSLWNTLEILAREHSDEPWLVGGDFNAVREMNEVCRASGDIRMAMEEFNVGIQEAGLIPLPMQGEWYTWHNCSTNSRSLWKRLDRNLINDRWLARFPSSCCHCLLPRTSDHSPLLLHGDRQNQTGALKPVFREQRRKKGDLTLNIQLAKGFLDEAQQLVSSDRQNEAFLLLEHCCRLVYAKAAKLEQIMLQQRAKMQWMKGGDQCSRIFFRKIAKRRVARRILQINDDNGTIHTEPEEIINEFVCYYQNLLGGNRRQITLDIGFLRPWARHILSNEEAGHLILAFTPDDVKQAVFDIADDKAPGLDGYSSGFFKAAWPVVGQEVTKAVLEFFCIGKLLKQVNSTLLALIPKRLSVVLDKIISPCQGAFILGRSIGDNILLAQELLTGYDQVRLPPRCTLKVDIRKAYDTVEWDFLLAVLQLFGFPQTFTRSMWIKTGDPLSPYLFVLVMEVLHLGLLQLIEQDLQFSYHWKCEPAKVFQLGFADDLLLFCRADLNSLRTLKRGLDRFAEWSGLRLNVQKSHVIISRSAQGWKDQILTIMGFQEGQLPMRYLGLPLLSSRLSISDCQPLLLKIDARINGCIYWASAFILPKAIIKQIEKRLRTFLWKGTSTSGYAKIAWKDVCKPIKEGGQGIKDIGILNRSLIAKKLCDVIRCDRTSIWVECSILPMTEFLIGEGRSFYLWKDPWHHLGPLIARYLLGLDESAKLQVVINEGQWQWPFITDLECMEIIYMLPQIHGGDDRINWRFSEGRPTTQSLYRLFCPSGPKVGWSSLLSGSLKIPRHNFILWLAIQEKLPTTDKPWMTHLGGCILCDEDAAETHTHMFFRCRYSRRCLAAIRHHIQFAWPNREWTRDVEWASRKWRGKHIVNVAYRALLGACIYHIWRETNLRRFEHTHQPEAVLFFFR
ncbi:UNVERIFIED_CONTAM: hypothetical protein Sindi_1300200 [Sesamum indicum]